MDKPYIECGPGWAALYEPLIALAKRDGVRVLQVKEKFGALRFYIGHASDELDKAIVLAEQKSITTCELCGAPGAMRDHDGWLRIRCDTCNISD